MPNGHAHLHMAPQGAQTANRGCNRGLDPEGLDADMCAALGNLDDLGRDIAIKGIHACINAQRQGMVDLFLHDIHNNHKGPKRLGQDRGRKANAARAMHRDPFTRLHSRAPRQSVP